MKTGIFLRVKRDDEWENLDLSELSEDEVAQLMERKDAPELRRWVSVLARILREAPGAGVEVAR